jgi:predicted protein tyrosine phosphatase
MQFIITDRDGVEHGVLVRCPYVVISIRDPDKRAAIIPARPGLRDVLYLAFHDAEPAAHDACAEGVTLMAEDQARQVWEFVRRWEGDVGAVVVQCEQGMSRSPAVAAALCRAYGGDWERFFEEYLPNRHVYGMVLRGGAAGSRFAIRYVSSQAASRSMALWRSRLWTVSVTVWM